MKKIFLFLFLLCFAGTASADSAAPVEISAAKSLEWDRKDRTYTARGNVVATQGTARIESDVMVARYTEGGSGADFSALEADGNVVLQSPPYTATGDHAIYNVKTGHALLTGRDLKITTATDLMTAEDKIEFFSDERRLTATGRATATHESYTVTADTLSAYFDKDARGDLAVKKITARGNVTIKTDKETVTGDEGVYDIPTQKAVLTGKVVIRQGQNWLEGTSAHVDMTTGISQLLGGGSTGKDRVKGVFYPGAAPQKTESR